MSISNDLDQIILKYVKDKPLKKKEKSILKDWLDQSGQRAELLKSMKDRRATREKRL